MIVPLSRVRRADLDRCGGKAANLGELLAAGFPVPNGFVLSREAVEQGVEQLNGSLTTALAPFGDAVFAVRSSALAEDLADASFAGLYETVLGVRGQEAVRDAVTRCARSVDSDRVAAYRDTQPIDAPRGIAVLVQEQIQADFAGVAFTADPVSGDRDRVWVSGVKGLGEKLVSGEAKAEEWVVVDGVAEQLAGEGTLASALVLEVSELARRVERHFDTPQDIEWAFRDGQLYLLQARPITVLPDREAFDIPGSWTRNVRLGEWLPEALTPLSATWLIADLHEALNAAFRKHLRLPSLDIPYTLVNNWYYYDLEFVKPSLTALKMLFFEVLPQLVLRPRWQAILNPAWAKYAVPSWEAAFEAEIEPRYLALVERATREAESRPVPELPALVDEIIAAAGEFFLFMACIGGYSWKTELALAKFYNAEIGEGSVLSLIQGTGSSPVGPHSVQSLDWFHPTLGELGLETPPATDLARSRRQAAIAEVEAQLDEGRKATLRSLLADVETYADVRERQMSDFTRPWPILRRCARRMGEHLVELGVIDDVTQLFFLEREELDTALAGDPTPRTSRAKERAARWKLQRRLPAPLFIGEPKGPFGAVLAEMAEHMRATDEGDVTGMPASPGVATGIARVIRGPADFDRLGDGEILVARATLPAWTPLFRRAAAVVTDVGSVVAHASLVAREYGIPAVVGTSDGTLTIPDGALVEVDGTSGSVRILNRQDS